MNQSIGNDPTNFESWIEIASARALDAMAIQAQGTSLGAAYMAGYVVECTLKGYITTLGKDPKLIHSISALWQKAEFRFSDCPRGLTFYFDYWDPILRYRQALPDACRELDLVTQAQRLAGWIRTRTRRKSARRRR